MKGENKNGKNRDTDFNSKKYSDFPIYDNSFEYRKGFLNKSS